MSYNSVECANLPIQVEHRKDPYIEIGPRIENHLGYTENESVQLRLEERIKELQCTNRQDLDTFRESLQQSEETVSRYSEHIQMLESELMNHRDERNLLRQQLQQAQADYTSLRSQLQLQENVEQSDIVQSLKDLNRAIDDLGRSVSSFLVDNYVRTLVKKDPIDATALDARHLPELKKLLGHIEGRSSLIASSSGVGMRVEDFFDYTIRSLLCRQLCKRIFYPFHPGVSTTLSDIMADMYHNVCRKGTC
ncbi:hypothetical protein BDV93DRAFT_183856 [Ceratobasidium sp. AG-I]|nr:hypothetical protein BDV93DRAFT_183856 [Ceratobasidium sp. AG-I]